MSKLRLAVALIIAVGVVGFLIPTPPVLSFEELKQSQVVSDLRILDRKGFQLDFLRVDYKRRQLAWLRLGEFPEFLRKLLQQEEDQRFFRHSGVDYRALFSAARDAVQGHPRGGSTLSMQLYALLQKRQVPKEKWQRPLWRMRGALALEKSWSKDEILESYLNLAPSRGDLIGFPAAAQFLFGKKMDQISEIEAAALVALLRSPNTSIEKVRERMQRMLTKANKPAVDLADFQFSERKDFFKRHRSLLPVFANELIQQKRAGEVQTSLDSRVQELAYRNLQDSLKELAGRNVQEGAVLVLNTKTSEVLAYVGNPGPTMTEKFEIDGVQARRQYGSTLKPFIYAKAFEKNILTPNSLIDDNAQVISVGQGQVYDPKSYDFVFRGPVRIKEALASSLNVPAVKTMMLVGQNDFVDLLMQLGFSDMQSADYYGPSLALGTLDGTLWDLAHAYQKLSVHADDNLLPSLFSKETKQKVFEVLSSAENRRLTFGTGSILNLPFPAMVKTGTSKDMRDNWCVGFSDHFLVAVWVGNFSGESMWNVSGVSGAAVAWSRIMRQLHQGFQFEARPPDAIDAQEEAVPRPVLSKFKYPVNDMIVAQDPDIPLANQRILVQIQNPQKKYQIYKDGVRLAFATERVWLSPTKGTHLLELRSAEGQQVDQIRFQVR